jgi:hypothetical protein
LADKVFAEGLGGEEQPALFSEASSPGSADLKVEKEREALLYRVSASKLDTLQEKVAGILNHHPDTRESDITLMLTYWDAFESELGGGDYIEKKDLYELTRLTSLSRARAKIQNTYGLFLASAEVRKHRGKLSEQEREKAGEQRPIPPLLDVYADESGKTGKHLVVGSVWFLHAPEELRFIQDVKVWREERKFTDEFHFQDIKSGSLPAYKAFADFLVERSSVISFKAISVARSGIGRVDEALEQLYYFLLTNGASLTDS